MKIKNDKRFFEISQSMYGEIPKSFIGYNVKNITEENIETAIFWKDDEIVVAFAGTEIYDGNNVINIGSNDDGIQELKPLMKEEDKIGKYDDWKINMNFNMILTGIGYVHEGFYKGVKKVYDKIEKIVKHLLNTKDRKVYLTGHSQGGSFAIVAGALLSYDIDPSKIEIIPIAPARVGDERFSNSLKVVCRAYFNNNDILQHLPPKKLGYADIGTRYYFNRNGKLMKSNNALLRFFDRVLGMIKSNLIFDKITDHKIERYIENIRRV